MNISMPKLRYVNMRKKFPHTQCYENWAPKLERYWSGKLWYLSIHGHGLVLDFRGGHKEILRDLILRSRNARRSTTRRGKS